MRRSMWWACLCALSIPAQAEVLPRFANSVFQQDVSTAPVRVNSATMIAASGDFGFERMQIDLGMHVLHAPPGTPTVPVVAHSPSSEYYLPDCEPLGTGVPLPAGGAIEWSDGYTCDNSSEDCHLLVVQGDVLHEVYSANVASGSEIDARCLVRWYLNASYPATLRGEHCTGADAAGFPIAPLLFNADEIRAAMAKTNPADRHLGHALRFILPNARMASLDDAPPGSINRTRIYVRPAAHAGGPVGPSTAIPYGSRLRLRADFPMTNYSPAAQVLLRTMQRYGIVLADGGNIALTGESDRFTTAKWSDPDIALGTRVFDQTVGAADVELADFEILDTGAAIVETYDCVPNDIVPPLFVDGFE
ncbi:MAG TPA: hypothetical protein VN581_04965 [Patescibacteria group bacterium]|nr:hypothetical protein [Patescibacteria group bacterium]